jgi:hypothetical protein
MKKRYISVAATLFAISLSMLVPSHASFSTHVALRALSNQYQEDYDPLVNVAVTVTVHAVRMLNLIDEQEKPDLFMKVSINGNKHESPIWSGGRYLYDIWSVTQDVPDDRRAVDISVALFDRGTGVDTPCDIGNGSQPVTIIYDIGCGRWTGDDHVGDDSGYGRLCGCDDGSIYENENDCELWFSVSQNDYDGDGLTYWEEVNVYGTDPAVDDTGRDDDGDGIPIEWEDFWGFDPQVHDDHETLDPDNDSISNIEESHLQALFSDPFRRDVFLELDCMNENADESVVSQAAVEQLKNPFHRRNIVFHVNIDEVVPFDDFTDQQDVLELYRAHFLNSDVSPFHRGVYHYGVFVHHCFPTGYSFAGDGPIFWGYGPGTNAFVVSSTMMERYHALRPGVPLDFFHASVIMHEIGHHFGIRFGTPFGCDNQFTKYPWQVGWWLFRNYQSIMNYRYTYGILDYSDGSHGKRDFDDWSYLKFDYFELPDAATGE